jgi:hypothetical protein
MSEIKGKLNVFKFIGTYDNTTGEWTNEVPDTDDFVFDLKEDGTCYVITDKL